MRKNRGIGKQSISLPRWLQLYWTISAMRHGDDIVNEKHFSAIGTLSAITWLIIKIKKPSSGNLKSRPTFSHPSRKWFTRSLVSPNCGLSRCINDGNQSDISLAAFGRKEIEIAEVRFLTASLRIANNRRTAWDAWSHVYPRKGSYSTFRSWLSMITDHAYRQAWSFQTSCRGTHCWMSSHVRSFLFFLTLPYLRET